MKYKIIYFSGTGNTQLIAQEIKSGLKKKNKQVSIISIEKESEIRKLDFSDSVIGFGFPVYKLSYPTIFNKYMDILNQKAANTPCFIFSTYTRFNGSSINDFKLTLDRKKWMLLCEENFKCPSCGISARKKSDDYEYTSVMFFEDNIQNKLDNFVRRIMKTTAVKIPFSIKSPIQSLIHSIVSNIELTKYPKLQIDYNCIGCGLCVKHCPEENLLKTGTYIQIKNTKHCLHCLRCMHNCPVNAICFGKLTKGPNRYTFKERDALFKQAVNGTRNKYWKNFKKITNQWKKQTIIYWLKNRKKPEI